LILEVLASKPPYSPLAASQWWNKPYKYMYINKQKHNKRKNPFIDHLS
jgi:hypothetical protein